VKMSRAKGVAKSLEQLTKELEDGLHALARQRTFLHNGDVSAVRELAGTLRNLICYSSGLVGLLWRMVQEYGVNDTVQVRYLGEANGDLTRGMVLAFLPPDYPRVPLAPCSLRWHIERHEAIYVEAKSLTAEEVILQVAQNFGASHAAPTVTREMAQIAGMAAGTVQPMTEIIDSAARLTLEVGERALVVAAAHGFTRRKPSLEIIAQLVQRVALSETLDVPMIGDSGGSGSWFFQIDAPTDEWLADGTFPVRFRSVRGGNVVMQMTIDRKRRLVFEVKGLAVPNFGARTPFPSPAPKQISVGITWKGADIRLYFQGVQIAGRSMA
jgi:hypothetical protein